MIFWYICIIFQSHAIIDKTRTQGSAKVAKQLFYGGREISDQYWFAVHVKSRHEFQVHERLTTIGIETFLPIYERLSKWKDRNRLIRMPLFPCYLFVHLTGDHDAKLSVLKTKGVVRFLGAIPGEPEIIPDEQINSLQKVIENKASLDPYPYLQEGQRVRIKNGPLAGVEGILVERAGQHKLILSVDILCQSSSVTIQASEVEEI